MLYATLFLLGLAANPSPVGLEWQRRDGATWGLYPSETPETSPQTRTVLFYFPSGPACLPGGT